MQLGGNINTLDSKGRLLLPPNVKSAFQERGVGELMLTSFDRQCIRCYAPKDWKEVQSKYGGKSLQMDEQSAKLLRVAAYNGAPVRIDKTGRILVPPALREYAGLTGPVHILALPYWVELWNPERLEEHIRKVEKEVPELMQAVGSESRAGSGK